MCIKAAELRKEDLALHVYSGSRIGARLDEQCYLFQLAAERRIRKESGKRRVHTAQSIIRLDGARSNVTRGFHEFEVSVERAQFVERSLSRRPLAVGARHRQLENVCERSTRIRDGQLPCVDAGQNQIDTRDRNIARKRRRAVQTRSL